MIGSLLALGAQRRRASAFQPELELDRLVVVGRGRGDLDPALVDVVVAVGGRALGRTPEYRGGALGARAAHPVRRAVGRELGVLVDDHLLLGLGHGALRLDAGLRRLELSHQHLLLLGALLERKTSLSSMVRK